MIGKGTQHNNGVKLARYMITGKDGERAELFELRGFASADIEEAFSSVHVMAEATKCTQPFFHVQVRNPEGEHMPDEHWRRAADRIESILGLKGQPRAITFHIDEQTGDRHMHAAWSRIDEDTLTAKHLPFFKLRLKRVSRELEKELGLTIVANERKGAITYAPTRAEDEEARRRGVDIHQTREAIRSAYDHSENGRDFDAALAREGLMLARGNDRDFIVINHAGGMHLLGKRLLGVTAAKIRDHLSDLARDELPTVDQARAYLAPAHQQEKRQDQEREPEKPEPIPDYEPQATAELPTHFDFPKAVREIDELIAAADPEQVRRVQQKLESDEAQRQIEANNGATIHGLRSGLAEIDTLLYNHMFRRADQQQDHRLQEPQAPIWDRDRANEAWEDSIIHAAIEQEKAERNFAEPAPGETRGGGKEQEPAQQPEAKHPAPELGKTQGEIRLARMLTPGPQSFANAIEDRGFILAAITPADIKREMEQLHQEWEERRRNPQTWMEHEGGFKTLTPELQESARRSFDAWEEKQEQKRQKQQEQDNKISTIEPSADDIQKRLESYVEYVQRKFAEGPTSQLERATGGLAVITPFGSVYTLTPRNTGLDRDELPHYLKGIDRAPLLSVTDAQAVMQDVREFRREEWLQSLPEPGGVGAKILDAYRHSDCGQAFAAALEDRNLHLARVTQEQAYSSRRLAAFAKEIGNRFAPELTEGELVVVNQFGNVYRLTPRNTRADDATRQAFLADLKPEALLNLTDTKAVMQDVREFRREEWRRDRREEWLSQQPLGRTAGEIRLAYSLTQTGQQFANAIEDRGFILAHMIDTDAERLNRWEKQRLKEEWTAPAPEKTGNAQSGKHGPEDKYNAGELVVINQYGQVFQLTAHSTGDKAQARAERLKDIDRDALLSVTDARRVMRDFQHHRQEERRKTWQQQREEWLRPDWLTNPPQPERKAPGLFHQAATEAARDERTENLQGVAAQVWTAFRQSGNEKAFETLLKKGDLFSVRTGDRKAFAATLDERAIAFAVVTKEEADRSESKEAAFARAVGNYVPRFKEGEIVLITEPRLEYRRDGQIIVPNRVHKLDQTLAEKFVKTLDNRSQLQGIEATKQKLDTKAQQRSDERDAERMDRATWMQDWAPERGKKNGHKIARLLAGLGKAANPVIEGGFDGPANLTAAALSFFDPPTTPAQREQAAENSREDREAQGQHQIDLSKYTTDRAQERQNHQEQQAARDRQREIDRDRG